MKKKYYTSIYIATEVHMHNYSNYTPKKSIGVFKYSLAIRSQPCYQKVHQIVICLNHDSATSEWLDRPV